MTTHRIEIVGPNFKWDSSDCAILDCRDGSRRCETDYSAKVDVYEDRVDGWFLNVAENLLKEDDSPGDYVVITIALAQLEGIEQFRRGETARDRKPKESERAWFVSAGVRAFPGVSNPMLERLWDSVRCGLAHSGFTEDPVLVSRAWDAALHESGGLHINPKTLLHAVRNFFDEFVKELRADSNSEAARNFARCGASVGMPPSPQTQRCRWPSGRMSAMHTGTEDQLRSGEANPSRQSHSAHHTEQVTVRYLWHPLHGQTILVQRCVRHEQSRRN